MKNEEVRLRLIFVNHNSTHEMTVGLSTLVTDLKKTILSSHLPENFTPITEIDHIRLLNSGRELDDAKSINDAHLQIPAGSVIPVHVVTVLKSVLSSSNRAVTEGSAPQKDKPPSCWCIIC